MVMICYKQWERDKNRTGGTQLSTEFLCDKDETVCVCHLFSKMSNNMHKRPSEYYELCLI